MLLEPSGEAAGNGSESQFELRRSPRDTSPKRTRKTDQRSTASAVVNFVKPGTFQFLACSVSTMPLKEDDQFNLCPGRQGWFEQEGTHGV